MLVSVRYQVWNLLKMAYKAKKEEKNILRTFVKKLIFLPANKGCHINAKLKNFVDFMKIF